MAGGLGLEPKSAGPKPAVLPLDDPPAVGTSTLYANSFFFLSEYDYQRLDAIASSCGYHLTGNTNTPSP